MASTGQFLRQERRLQKYSEWPELMRLTRTRGKVVAKGTALGDCRAMRYFALILMLIAPSWAGAEPEKMECSLIEAFEYTAGTPHKRDFSAADNKTFITIEDDVLAINYNDTGADIFTQRNGRIFIKTSDESLYVYTIVLGGSACTFGDKDERKVSYVMIDSEYTYTEMLRCSCK